MHCQDNMDISIVRASKVVRDSTIIASAEPPPEEEEQDVQTVEELARDYTP